MSSQCLFIPKKYKMVPVRAMMAVKIAEFCAPIGKVMMYAPHEVYDGIRVQRLNDLGVKVSSPLNSWKLDDKQLPLPFLANNGVPVLTLCVTSNS